MGRFRKKSDPIEERARALDAELASLDAQIRKLSAYSQQHPPPKLRSTARPQGAAPVPAPPAPNPAREPVFEEINQKPFKNPAEPISTPQHYNDLGVRKYDLAALIRRWQNHFRGKPPTNPKLVSYLAAGSIHGLRPLRYEKRIARNRFLVFSIILAVAIWGLLILLHRR